MSKSDFQQLENLLSQLGSDVGSHRLCIITGVAGENYQLATYNSNGNMMKMVIGIDIENCVTQIKQNLNDKE